MPWFLLCISRTFWTISFCTRRLRCFLALASIIRPSLTLMLLKWSLPFFLRSSKTSQCFLPLLLLSDEDSPLSTSTSTLILLPGQDQSNHPPLILSITWAATIIWACTRSSTATTNSLLLLFSVEVDDWFDCPPPLVLPAPSSSTLATHKLQLTNFLQRMNT